MKKLFEKVLRYQQVVLIQVTLMGVAMLASGCDPAELVDPASYGPTEGQVMETTYWCGYQAVEYAGFSEKALIPTLFRINPMDSEVISVNTATVVEWANVRHTYNYNCSYTGQSSMNCEGKEILYKILRDTLDTNLLTSAFHDLNLRKFVKCTQGEMLFFEDDK